MTLHDYLIENSQQLTIQEDDIVRIETDFDIVFSDELRNFFKTYNGTRIPVCLHDKFTWLEVSCLEAIKHGTPPVEKIMEWNYADGFIDKGLVPIASDRGGDYFYCDTVNNGRILFIDHEDIENPEVIDSDISSFLQNLTVTDE